MTSSVTVIDKLAYGGNGVCRIEGKVCFVPYSCPGDRVRLQMTSQKKSYCTADISEIVQSSPDRAVPVCPIFGNCGGCSWQHISYPVQLQQKRQIFSETLWRGGRVDATVIRETVASPLEYNYRSRVQFKVSGNRNDLKIGFYRTGSHSVVDAVGGCPVAKPVINEIQASFRSILKNFDDVGQVEQISIEVGVQGAVAIVHYAGKNLTGIKAFLSDNYSALRPCTGLFLQVGRKYTLEKLWGDSEISYHMPRLKPEQAPYLISYFPGGFAQINQTQNVAILSIIRMFADFRSTEKLLDLYCGNGNFSIPLSGEVVHVLGIEGSERSIRSAEYNKTANGLRNIEFICADVQDALDDLVKNGRLFDVVLLDPPRNGAADAVSNIAGLKPEKIIYVSCDPSTLARDCGLFAAQGYRVVESVPLDMFPHTYHLESVTLLIKE